MDRAPLRFRCSNCVTPNEAFRLTKGSIGWSGFHARSRQDMGHPAPGADDVYLILDAGWPPLAVPRVSVPRA